MVSRFSKSGFELKQLLLPYLKKKNTTLWPKVFSPILKKVSLYPLKRGKLAYVNKGLLKDYI